MKHALSALLLLTFGIVHAQDAGLRYTDYIYKPNIRTVRFHINGLFTSYPIVDLNSGTQLALSFDDMDANAKNYTYSLVHCNAYWEPSNLAEMEYIDGFTEERVENFQFSFKTVMPYTHYRILLPNQRLSFTKSGNYLIKVYESERKKTLVLSRRFVVVEPVVRVVPNMARPGAINKTRTHQEIDFVVNHEKLEIRSPQQEVRAVILQNGRWDNAVRDLPPLFIRPNEMIFDHQDKVVFPAGKEFRPLDLRSLRSRSQNIALIEQVDSAVEVTLAKDTKRSEQVYLSFRDLNGNFVIENFDQRDPDLSGSYANVLFSLYSPEPYYDDDVYIFGALTGWQLQPEFKMQYNSAVNGYVAKVPIKQGYYDYAYALVPRNAKTPIAKIGALEGDWYETENQYTILIYYRPFGERYDRVIGAATFTSNF